MMVATNVVSTSISGQAGSAVACTLASAALAQAQVEASAIASSALFRSRQVRCSVSSGSRTTSSSGEFSTRLMALLRVFRNTKSPPDAATVAASARSRGILRAAKTP